MSPEAPVPVVRVQRESVVLGGAANVVRNVVALGGGCDFCSVVGDDPDGRQVVDLLTALGVVPSGIVRVAERATTRKTRVVARSQQVVRFDRETTEPIADFVAVELLERVESSLPSVDGVVLQDYAKGLFAPVLIGGVMQLCKEAGSPVFVDPKARLAEFRGAALVKPNLHDAERLTGVTAHGPADLDRIADRVRQEIGACDLVLTRGGEGMTVFETGRPRVDVRTVTQQVYDVQGAGDTTIAVLSLAMRAGATLLEAAVLANAAAGVVVEKVGTATASPDEVRAFLPAAIEAAEMGSGDGE